MFKNDNTSSFARVLLNELLFGCTLSLAKNKIKYKKTQCLKGPLSGIEAKLTEKKRKKNKQKHNKKETKQKSETEKDQTAVIQSLMQWKKKKKK